MKNQITIIVAFIALLLPVVSKAQLSTIMVPEGESFIIHVPSETNDEGEWTFQDQSFKVLKLSSYHSTQDKRGKFEQHYKLKALSAGIHNVVFTSIDPCTGKVKKVQGKVLVRPRIFKA